DLSKPGVIVTPFGAFEPNPVPGQQIIPRNFGRGPGFFSVNFGVSKTIKFGPAIAPKAMAAATGGAVTTVTATAGNATASTTGAKPPAKPSIQRPYQLGLGIYVNNLLNHTNPGPPVGNMASPFFLKSTGTSNIFFFGPGGGGGSGGNRSVV